MNLVRFDCGCIGFAPDKDGNALIVEACDSDDGERISFFEQSMKNMDNTIKSYKPLTEIGVGQLKTKIQCLISDGYKFREIKRLLS